MRGASICGVFAIPAIGIDEPFFQPNAWSPAHRLELAGVEELARCAVGLRRVEAEGALIADNVGNRLRKLGDGQIFAPADVDMAFVGIALDQEYRRVGEIVDMQKFASRLTAAPDIDLACAGTLGVVDFHDQRWNDVAAFEIVTIAGTVKVGGLGGNKIALPLPAIGGAQLQAGDLGDG